MQERLQLWTVCSREMDSGGLSAVCGGFRLCKMEEGSRFFAPFGRKGNGLTKFPGEGGKQEGSVE